jgi:hypothetical protein
MQPARKPLSPGAAACLETIGARVPKRYHGSIPAWEHSDVGQFILKQQERLHRIPPYTMADYERHLRGEGPDPWEHEARYG